MLRTTLDGGGLRGLSSLFILREIMAQLNSSPSTSSRNSGFPPGTLKPCDVFDVIGGTSVGGYVSQVCKLEGCKDDNNSLEYLLPCLALYK